MLMLNFARSMGFFSHVTYVYFKQVWKMSSRTPVAPAGQEIFQIFASKEGDAEWIINPMSSHNRKSLPSKGGLWDVKGYQQQGRLMLPAA